MASNRGRAGAGDRRTLLHAVGGDLVSSPSSMRSPGGLYASAGAGGSVDSVGTVPAGRYRPDECDRPEVTSAEVVIHEDGSVSEHLHVDPHELARRREGDADRETRRPLTTYSVELELAEAGPDRGRALATCGTDDDGLRAVVKARDRTVDEAAVGTDRDGAGPASDDAAAGRPQYGLTEEPALGAADCVAYGQTESQECGPLVRTNVAAVLDDTEDPTGDPFAAVTADREAVDGDACVGDVWDASFAVLCDFFGALPGYDCEVPSVFDTSWNVAFAEQTGRCARSVFTCEDFPLAPDTVVVAHEVALTTGTGTDCRGSGTDADGAIDVGVEFHSTIGVAPPAGVRAYDFDANGVTNLVVDGLAAVFPELDAEYSYALAAFLLKHDSGIVT